jgi:hypothetical protein
MWHSAVSSLLQLCCELVIEREINFKEHTELPDDVMAKLERTNVESSDRRFRVLHIPTAQHSTLYVTYQTVFYLAQLAFRLSWIFE